MILASRWVHFSREFEKALDSKGVGGPTLLSGTLAGLGQRPVSTVVLGQVPEFRQNVSFCIARAEFYKRDAGSCTLVPAAEIAQRHRPVNEYFAALQKRYAFKVVNSLPAFCDAAWCRAIDNGEALMWDEHHLTVAGALHAVPYIQIPGLSRIAAERQALAETKPE